jgi:hypothetical protein
LFESTCIELEEAPSLDRNTLLYSTVLLLVTIVAAGAGEIERLATMSVGITNRIMCGVLLGNPVQAMNSCHEIREHTKSHAAVTMLAAPSAGCEVPVMA